jgi:7,8-dihydropterin-6-yl-methyl-4-(beta-D-ribofuranosyl)aminobenzene 5'-phosphate synthase
VKVAPRITVLYDAFGKTGVMKQDWGYAAFIEYAGKRILFDTGNDPAILAGNAKASHIDLSKLDLVIMSHRHGDHMGGLAYVLRINPSVRIYAPKEGFGVYGSDLPGTFYRRDTTLEPEQRYYDGTPPEIMRFGSAWPAGKFQRTSTGKPAARIARAWQRMREAHFAIAPPFGQITHFTEGEADVEDWISRRPLSHP